MVADLIDFLHASPTPFHAVAAAVDRLDRAGFSALDLLSPWADLRPGRYYVRRGDSSLVAFVVPHGAASCFRLVGAHTDSPNLRVKTNAVHCKEGYGQLGVEVYGGVLLNSWLDRDLGLAGRVIVKSASGLRTHLVRIDRPLARVAQLAIHLDREVNDKGLVLHRQEHLAPIWAQGSVDVGDLLALVGEPLGIAPGDVLAHDLMLYDLTAPTLAGRDREFLFSARLDDLAMCHAAIAALVDAAPRVPDGGAIAVAALFDHEEVGSLSSQGADSVLLPQVLERLAMARGADRAGYLQMLAGSRCLSADMSHAVHPNYAERHEARHKPVLNGGPVIKYNSQQRYATSARGAAEVSWLCRANDLPYQSYVHRTDLPCGGTIGPVTSSILGIDTVDLGNPMLSMHSAREMAGAKDPELMTRLLAAFLAHAGELSA